MFFLLDLTNNNFDASSKNDPFEQNMGELDSMNVAMKTWPMQCWPEWVMQHNYNKLESLHGLVEFFTWWCPVTFVGL